jgi:hypothetical protein
MYSLVGKNIMQGAIFLWSTAKFIRQKLHKERLFVMNLDFYCAYDRVCLLYVDKVLAAMGFGSIFRKVVPTLHMCTSVSFLLHRITRAVPNTSIRQGWRDFITKLLYNIQLQPFLLRLEDVLPSVSFPDF